MLIFVSRKLIHKRELLKYLYCKIFIFSNKADNLCFHWPRRMRILDWPTFVIGRSVGCYPPVRGKLSVYRKPQSKPQLDMVLHIGSFHRASG